MGNTQKNDDFSKNTNFNINQHNQQMNQYRGNYGQPQNFDQQFNAQQGEHFMGNNYLNRRPKAKQSQTHMAKIQRNCSMYKPSLTIHENKGQFQVKFDYDSTEGNFVQFYIGVEDIRQNQETKATLGIKSKIFYEETLVAGKKLNFHKSFGLDGFSSVGSATTIIRFMTFSKVEKTEYSIRKVRNPNDWKVILQKFQLNHQVTQLENIYRGDQQNAECIICLTQKPQVFLIPCNHLCICGSCSEAVRTSTNKCPICRSTIKEFKKIV